MKYLYNKDGVNFVECENCHRILKIKDYQINDVKTGIECFCGNYSDIITGLPGTMTQSINSPHIDTHSSAKNINGQSQSISEAKSIPKPKCPTCGSADVEKISIASKAVGGYMWGIFSSNVRNTFKCNNCGYKW